MGTQTDKLRELAGRYRAGLCTPEEIEQIKEWYDSFESNGYPLPDEAQIERASKEAALAAIKLVNFQNRRSRIRKLMSPVLKVAAVVLVICSAGLLIYRYNSQHPEVSFREISALGGERKQITLPDGSVIILNSASRIRYPAQFAGDTREIHLNGQAFFEVAHDRQHPFIIHTEKLKVQVLGTSFDVKAYHEDEHIEVVVATGKVGVTSGDKKNVKVLMLTPGQLLDYDKSTGNFSRKQLRIADIAGWQENILTFNYETLENISHALERVYGVTFVFRDKSALKKRFQLKVKNEALSNIMKLLSISGGGFRYKITGKQVIIG
ncbi:MAG TPA: FecR domain-containing protein [Pedobacter sp.]|uniref:FecR family protein n=1 Tax=Pedobacter sp. TaxID=1411316 RepID=UPI002CFCAAB0|nr:FecR domain-containing protein [Pedobacter sp.]HMI02480.1 FecR domain-containing protein [Pedobacter sp.]